MAPKSQTLFETLFPNYISNKNKLSRESQPT